MSKDCLINGSLKVDEAAYLEVSVLGISSIDMRGENTDKTGVDESEVDCCSFLLSFGSRHGSCRDQALSELCSVGDIPKEPDVY